MEFCKYYGITATKVLLISMNPMTFEKGIKLLNNPADYKFVTDFKDELILLKQFLNDRVEENYSDVKVKKLHSRYKRNLNYKRKYAIKSYDGNIDTLVGQVPHDEISKVAKTLMSDKEQKEAEELFETAPKSMSETILGLDNKRHRLTPEQIKIIKYFKSKEKYIDAYLGRIKESTFIDQQVFGRKLYRVMSGNGIDIKNTVAKVIKKSEKDEAYRAKVIKSYKQDILTLKSKILTSEEFKERKSQSERKSNLVVSNPELVELIQLCDRKLANKEVIDIIETMYDFSKVFTVDYYNNMFDIDLDANEMKRQFNELSRIGLVGLNLYTLDFLKNFLSSVTFAEEIEDFVEEGTDLAKSVRDIDRLLSTILPFGTELEVE